MLKRMTQATGLALALMAATPALAAIEWTDWTSANASGASGTLGSATVTFNGGLDNWQTSGGADYWRQGGTTPWAAYDGVGNLPANNDFIAISQPGTITFSTAVTNPYLAIISLGQPNINTQWTFDAPFTIVDQGQGHWGNGALTNLPGNVLGGLEGHGIIQFTGTFTSLTISGVANQEFWSGLTIGADSTSPVPEPATWAMMIGGLGLVGSAMRRSRRSARTVAA